MVKYQIFISSVSRELKEERKKIIESMIESNKYFPIAMEYFPANDCTIKLLYHYLLDADAYVLILKDELGSPIGKNNAKQLADMTKENEKLAKELDIFCSNTGLKMEQITYTQLEYVFAGALGIKKNAYIYKASKDDSKTERIKRFCGSTMGGNAKSWSDEQDLIRQINTSLDYMIENDEDGSLGWVRRKNDPMFVKFREIGINNISLDGNGYGHLLKDKLENASELDLFFTTGRGFVVNNQPQLAAYIAKGGIIRLLCGFPQSRFLEDVANVEQFKYGDRKDIHKEFDLVFKTFQHIYAKAKNDWEEAGKKNDFGRILIGDSGSLFRSTIAIVKFSENKNWGWITVTLPPEKSIDMVSLEIEQKEDSGKDNLMRYVTDHFNCIWEIAKNNSEVYEIDENTNVTSFVEDYIQKKLAEIQTETDVWKARHREIFNQNDLSKQSDYGLKDLDYWKKKYKESLKEAKKRKGNHMLIEVAAQHPLKDNQYPDVEFQARLDYAIEIMQKEIQKGYDVEIYVPGSVHLDFEGIEDDVSLSEAGREYLIRNGVSSDIIHGEDLNAKYDEKRAWKGVYNSADECFIASEYFREGEFDRLLCICSPNQVIRKTLLYINQGIMPLIYSVPVDNMFHNPIGEIYEVLPYLLGEDHDWQGKDSKEALRTRKERMPGFKMQ